MAMRQKKAMTAEVARVSASWPLAWTTGARSKRRSTQPVTRTSAPWHRAQPGPLGMGWMTANSEVTPGTSRTTTRSARARDPAQGVDPADLNRFAADRGYGSHAFREHVWINPFWEDDPYEIVDLMGADRVIFGSDWPHIEGMPQPLDLGRAGEIAEQLDEIVQLPGDSLNPHRRPFHLDHLAGRHGAEVRGVLLRQPHLHRRITVERLHRILDLVQQAVGQKTSEEDPLVRRHHALQLLLGDQVADQRGGHPQAFLRRMAELIGPLAEEEEAIFGFVAVTERAAGEGAGGNDLEEVLELLLALRHVGHGEKLAAADLERLARR